MYVCIYEQCYNLPYHTIIPKYLALVPAIYSAGTLGGFVASGSSLRARRWRFLGPLRTRAGSVVRHITTGTQELE
jgi:hypothetical protein